MSVDVSLMPQIAQPGDVPDHYSIDAVPLPSRRYNALPIHLTEASRDGSPRSFADSESGAHAENMLRRKTPNGTLNAGFVGAVEGATQPVKHHLTEGHAPVPVPHVAPANGKRTFVEHERHQQWQRQQQRQHDAAIAGWNQSREAQWYSSQMPLNYRTSSSIPTVDARQNQNLGHYQNGQAFFGQTVPSVMQPSYQHAGPTASGGQMSGPYGPYWHDGTYVPYRPAAIRDARFYPQPVPMPANPISPFNYVQPFALPGPSQWPLQGSNSYNGIAPYSSNVNPLPSSSKHVYPRSLGLPIAAQQVQNLVPPYTYNQLPGPVNAQNASMVVSEFGSSRPYGSDRDRVFGWALQQYKELLAFIHQTRRQQQQLRYSHGQQQSSRKPNFYPKPPQQTAKGSSTQISIPLQGAGTDLTELSPQQELLIKDAHAKYTSSTEKSHEHKRRLAPFSVLERGNPRGDDNTPHAHYESSNWPSQAHVHDVNGPLQQQMPMQASPFITSYDQIQTPHIRAQAAFQHIDELCQESKWRWTDGIHLAGCLAYGLGSYPTALEMFTRVLRNDSKHLEATSNLAATLLALGRREEAEQHWIKVVKVAPTYFEAVEHLVGLLCNEQRSKEAIKVIDYVEQSLRQPKPSDTLKVQDRRSECSSSTASRSPCISELSDKVSYDFDVDGESFVMDWRDTALTSQPGFGSSGFAIPGSENGRILALIHAKGNMLYGLGDNGGAARAFEDAVLIATGREFDNIQGLVQRILMVVSSTLQCGQTRPGTRATLSTDPILLSPDQALLTSKLCFQPHGELPGLEYIGQNGLARKAVISTTSNSLLSLAKIFQDGMSNASRSVGVKPLAHGVRDILALYYLSLALQPSPSTANNVGILLASVQQIALPASPAQRSDIPGVVPGSGTALALAYYNYGLQLDKQHAHLYTNLGSLLKDVGQLDAAINMYEKAVYCDGKFDIALANLANAVKDKGRIGDAIVYYKRAVEVSPEFAEAVCGLANALNSVCSWQARGGIAADNGQRDRWHVDANGMLLDAKLPGAASFGWIRRVIEIVEKQLLDGENWGVGATSLPFLEDLVNQIVDLEDCAKETKQDREISLRDAFKSCTGRKWEGARVTRLIERATRRICWHWYHDKYVKKTPRSASSYRRPQLPTGLSVPTVPTVLPFHTFTCPMSAKQIRLISQRNGLRISVSTLRCPWIPEHVYPPPAPPSPCLRIGYVSSDFNNHPLAHLMQSVFGLHDLTRVEAYCYATTASDNSIHRQQIEAEAPVFHDASSWPAERLVSQIVQDGIHVLVNLNGYTRGARNEVFAARPAPIQMSFMGFASTLGAEWCDYLLADETAVPVDTLRPFRRNVDLDDLSADDNSGGENEEWVYGENIIYCRDTFFCCDHKQSAPDAQGARLTWEDEQVKRWQMRKELFPQISDDAIIFGNFNQLYKIDPTTFRTWLRILAQVPNSILWLLRFPDLGESHLLATARLWAGADVASRIIFTDVAPKHLHISRARVCDLVLDTAECNAHTTAADVLWSGTPLLTLPRYGYKMCSRMAASILKGALPKDAAGDRAAVELIASSEEDYEAKAVALGKGFSYIAGSQGSATGRLMELRQMLFHARWTSGLFDTRRWVRDLEDSYEEAWKRWVNGEGGDIWLNKLPRRKETISEG